MRKISIKGIYKAGTKPEGCIYRIYDEDVSPPKDMAEVMSFSLEVSMDDKATIGKIVWLDFSKYVEGFTDPAAIEDACLNQIPEVEETVEIVSIDVHSEA